MQDSVIDKLVKEAKTRDELSTLITVLRPIAANTKSKLVKKWINQSLKKSEILGEKKLMIFLYDLKIRQLYHLKENLEIVNVLLAKMLSLSEELNDYDCFALVNQITWHVEKFKGNKNISKSALYAAFDLVEAGVLKDSYIISFVTYSYAIEKWLSEHSPYSADLLKDCLVFFYKKGFYRSLAQTIGILSIIYMRTQETRKGLKVIENIMSNRLIFENMPLDVKGIIYFFVGVVHLLSMNLRYSEMYLTESHNYLKPSYRRSIYFSNYIILDSFLCTVTALQGRLKFALGRIREVDKRLEEDFFKSNLDDNTKNQITHTLNLNKFYVYSRLKDFDSNNYHDLINGIFVDCKTHYSDFMLLSEFILNANLELDKLNELMNINSFSLNRIKHIIQFMKANKEDIKEEEQSQRYLKLIEVLQERKITSKTTFIENVFADLLIAKQLHYLNRYSDVHTLLHKYKKSLHKIEVLELRIFMEAFTQAGEFNNGDLLAPALHFMAIKRCREHNFTRLEETLLNQQQTLRRIALNRLT